MVDLSRNFGTHEIECPCCGLKDIDLVLIGMLQAIRSYYGVTIFPTSGCRCRIQNVVAKGSEKSYHLPGYARGEDGPCRAIDWTIINQEFLRVIDSEWKNKWPGGWKWYPEKGIIHCDTGPNRRW